MKTNTEYWPSGRVRSVTAGPVTIGEVVYNIGNPRKLKHRRRWPWEILFSWADVGHRCVVCLRGTANERVSAWFQIQDGMKVCWECALANKRVFGQGIKTPYRITPEGYYEEVVE